MVKPVLLFCDVKKKGNINCTRSSVQKKQAYCYQNIGEEVKLEKKEEEDQNRSCDSIKNLVEA